MIQPSPENFGYLQVYRPVLDGATAFLAGVREAGEALGVTTVTSSTDIVINEETGTLGKRAKPITDPNLKVSDSTDLRMILMHRAVPRELSSRYSFGTNENRMSSANGAVVHHSMHDIDGNRHRVREQLPDLLAELAAVSISRDEDPRRLRAKSGTIGIMGEPGHDLIVSLLPDVDTIGSLILHEEAVLTFGRLARISSRAAYPVNPWIVGVPFARIPNAASDRDKLNFLIRVKRIPVVRLMLGAPEFDSSDKRDLPPSILAQSKDMA